MSSMLPCAVVEVRLQRVGVHLVGALAFFLNLGARGRGRPETRSARSETQLRRPWFFSAISFQSGRVSFSGFDAGTCFVAPWAAE